MCSIWAKIIIKAVFFVLAWAAVVLGVMMACPFDEKKTFIPTALICGGIIFVLVIICGISKYFYFV